MTAAEVVFVLPGVDEAEIERLRGLDVDRDWKEFVTGISAWIVQTYLLMNESGCSVSLSSRFSSESINVAHAASLAGRDRPRGCFVVGVRADYPAVNWCQSHIVQNQAQAGATSFWLPHWPQPGLISRNPERKQIVERVGYFGRSVNHYTRILKQPSGYFLVEATMQRACDRLGLELVHKVAEQWNDYSDVDIVVGLRSIGHSKYNNKPPTKMVNAWLASAVFVGGNDSAYRQVGQPNVNFLRVVTKRELHSTLGLLVADSLWYSKIKAAGVDASREFSRENIIMAWLALFHSRFGVAL